MKRENLPLQEEWETIIEYMIGSEEVRERIRKLKVGYKIDSD